MLGSGINVILAEREREEIRVKKGSDVEWNKMEGAIGFDTSFVDCWLEW